MSEKLGPDKAPRKSKLVEEQLSDQHLESFDLVRKRSQFAIYGRKSDIKLSLFQNMENVVATAEQRKRSGGTDCLITKKVKSLLTQGWPELEVEDAIRRAVIQINKQKTISQMFSKVEPSKDPVKESSKTLPSTAADQTASSSSSSSLNENNNKATNSPSALGKLCQQLEIHNYKILVANFHANDPIEILSKDMASDLKENELLTKREYKEARYRWLKGSKFLTAKNAVAEEIDHLKFELTDLVQILATQQGQTNFNLIENLALAARIAQKVSESRTNIAKSLSLLKQKLKAWKRLVTKRLSDINNGPKGVTLEANNLGKTWWKAEEELRELFEQEGSRKTKKHVGREVTVSGFNFKFYFSVKNLMYYYRVTGSECVPIEVIMSAAVDVSGHSTKKVIAAIIKHLPVACFHYFGKVLLLDCEALNSDKSLLVKVISLQKLPPKKLLSNPRVTKSSSQRRGKTVGAGRKPYHEQHPQVFQHVKDLIITGGVGGGEQPGIGADKRRRTELGMASINIPQIMRQVKPLLAPGDSMPSESVVRSWLSAPNNHRRYAGKFYKNLIPVRVPRKQNTKPVGDEAHPDAHQAAALVKYAREFGSRHEKSTNTWSNDDKAKMSIGLPLQHRLSQLPMYAQGTEPNFPDHDKRSGLLLVNSAYLRLKFKSEAVEQEVAENSSDDSDVDSLETDMDEPGELTERVIEEETEKFLQEIVAANSNHVESSENEADEEDILEGDTMLDPQSDEDLCDTDLEYQNLLQLDGNDTSDSDEFDINLNNIYNQKDRIKSKKREKVSKQLKPVLKIQVRNQSLAVIKDRMRGKSVTSDSEEDQKETEVKEIGGKKRKIVDSDKEISGEKKKTNKGNKEEEFVSLPEKWRSRRGVEKRGKKMVEENRSDYEDGSSSDSFVELDHDSDSTDKEDLDESSQSDTDGDGPAEAEDDPEVIAGDGTPKEPIKAPSCILDSLGREHIATPHGGQLFQFFASNHATPSTIAEHVNHLTIAREVIKDTRMEDKKIEMHVVDQGADWDYHAPITRYYLWQYFKYNKLNLLVFASFAPGQSRFNPVERYFGYHSRKRAGMILPDYLLDEEENQDGMELSVADKIYNQSIRLMLDHDRKLSGLEDQGIFSAGKFVGREGVIQFQAGGKVYRADTIDKSKFEQKRSLLNSNTLQQNLVKKDPRLVKELKMMNLHMELRKHAIIFRKCVQELGDSLCKMCRRSPHTFTEEVLKDLPSKDLSGGALFWDLKEDSNNEGHFRTLLETLTLNDQFQPDSCVPLPFQRCKEIKCSFSFTSTAEAERHLKHDHGFVAKDANAPAGYSCGFKLENETHCTEWFAKKNQRDVHKKISGHVKRRKKPQNEEAGEEEELSEEEIG